MSPSAPTPPSTGSRSWDEVRSQAPSVLAPLAALQKGLWKLVDARVLELCRLRYASLLGAHDHAALRAPAAFGAVDEHLIDLLPSWPTTPGFTGKDRACLALAEQFLLDVGAVDQKLVDDVLEHMSPSDCYTFVNALWAMEALQRSSLVLGWTPEPASLGLVDHRFTRESS